MALQPPAQLLRLGETGCEALANWSLSISCICRSFGILPFAMSDFLIRLGMLLPVTVTVTYSSSSFFAAVFSGLLQPLAAIVAIGGGMTIEHDAILIVDHVFLQMFGRSESLVERHMTSAVGATARRRHVDGPVVFRRCFSIPAGMTDGGAAFLLGRGRIRRRFARGGLVVGFLLVGGELVLPFELPFEFE